MGLPPCPENLKPIAHYLKVADEHDARDIVISYWSRLHAFEVGMKLTNVRTPETTKYLVSIMDWLEQTKSEQTENEGITSKICAQATVENYALQLFKYADEQDRAENYGKNVVKAFYTAGILMDVLTAFGDLSEDIIEKRKYAKWKAAYIHNCLKAGEKPKPGPMENNENDDDDEDFEPVNRPPGNITPNAFPNPPSNPSVTPTTSRGATAGWGFPATPQLPPEIPSVPSPSPQVTPSTSFVPIPTPAVNPGNPTSSTSVNADPEVIAKAQKYCKWATSALNYDDVKSAIDNLQKALHLLQLGKESPE